MGGWHHRLNGHESEQALGDGEGQGDLACCNPWGHRELDMTERLNNNNHLFFTQSSRDKYIEIKKYRAMTGVVFQTVLGGSLQFRCSAVSSSL